VPAGQNELVGKFVARQDYLGHDCGFDRLGIELSMRTVYIGADHRGYKLKESLKVKLEKEGWVVEDVGNNKYDPDDDFVDFSAMLAKKVKIGGVGIMICGSGVGAVIATNKFDGIRAGLLFEPRQARKAREDDNANVAVLAADFVDDDGAWEIVQTFLATIYMPTERFERRLRKIEALEVDN